MKIFLSLIFLFVLNIHALAEDYKASGNVWLKTYQNYKNYNTIISNISKIEYKIQRNSSDTQMQNQLYNKLEVYRSKLSLYEKNRSFDNLLIKYKFEVPEITLKEYIFKNHRKELNRVINKYILEKNQFYLAKSTLENLYENIKEEKQQQKDLVSLKNDIEYFRDYSENIEKVHQNLLESKEELNKKYEEYKNEVLIKHIFTLLMVFMIYAVYKGVGVLLKSVNQSDENYENYKNYNKLLSLVFGMGVFFFLFVRYIEDLIYLVTFLSVIAAALTIATREIILNIAGAVYIFFSSVVRVGDRVMIQFETKHTVGDIVDISIIKMKLNEVDDYNNIKEVKSAGRTIYIPNSYIFTKVFYNYSLKKKGLISDIIEFEFDLDNDFALVERVTSQLLSSLNIDHKVSFTLNSLKNAITAVLSYEVNYKEVSQKRGEIVVLLLEEYKKDERIKLKNPKKTSKAAQEEE